MIEIGDGAGVVSALLATYETTRGVLNGLRAKSKELKDQDLSACISDMYDKLTELKIKIDALVDENKSLSGLLEAKQKLSFKAPFYYCKDDETPFCPKCWEDGEKQIHLIEDKSSGHRFVCAICGFAYWIEYPKPVKPIAKPIKHFW